TAAMLGFLGPEQLGLRGLRVGAQVSEDAARQLVQSQTTSTLFREGAEDTLRAGIADISRGEAVTGRANVSALVEQVAAEGADRQAVERAIQAQLRSNTMRGMRNIVLNETDAFARNMAAGQIGSQGTEVLATAVGLEDPNTLGDRMMNSAVSTAAGVTMFHLP